MPVSSNLFPTFGAALLVGLVTTLLVFAFYHPRPERSGWVQLRPAASHWLGLFVSSAAAGLLLYIRLFVGSARADADSQMLMVLLLLAASIVAAIRFGAKIRRAVRVDGYWQGDQVEFVGGEKARVSKRLSDVVAMQKLAGGDTVIHFADGDWLRIDTATRGPVPLCNHIMAMPPESAPA